MEYPLIIAGKRISRSPFLGKSLFYPQYTFQLSNPTQLDIASAIGAMRHADPPSLSERRRLLERTADIFEFDDQLTQHVVRMTGMPISLIRNALLDIKRIFREVPETYHRRFEFFGDQDHYQQEMISTHLSKLFIPKGDFCYAVTPGNDPRAAAIVAANLGYLGIPFIVRASIRDAVAPSIIQAMVAAGFDPRFCNLIYLDKNAPDFDRKHFKLLQACACIWTFGPSYIIDKTLRYQIEKRVISIETPDPGSGPLNSDDLKDLLNRLSKAELNSQLRSVPTKVDRFEGKVVLRHESGNCAGVLHGALDEQVEAMLYPSIGYANVCTAMKTLMVIGDGNQIEQVADLMAGLVVGDPLQEDTQVGYIDERNLDHLADLVNKNSLYIRTYGGKRISKIQAKPLLVTGKDDLPDFLGQEIPAYVLTMATTQSVDDAVKRLNQHLQGKPRLGVSFFNVPEDELQPAIPKINAHIVLLDKPTSTLLPAFHEGNDYALLLTEGKLIYQ